MMIKPEELKVIQMRQIMILKLIILIVSKLKKIKLIILIVNKLKEKMIIPDNS